MIICSALAMKVNTVGVAEIAKTLHLADYVGPYEYAINVYD